MCKVFAVSVEFSEIKFSGEEITDIRFLKALYFSWKAQLFYRKKYDLCKHTYTYTFESMLILI